MAATPQTADGARTVTVSLVHGTRLKPLDSIREMAAAGTTAYHLPGAPLKGGIAGIDIFFILSGCLIGSIILQQAETGRLHISYFGTARAGLYV